MHFLVLFTVFVINNWQKEYKGRLEYHEGRANYKHTLATSQDDINNILIFLSNYLTFKLTLSKHQISRFSKAIHRLDEALARMYL